MAVVEALKMLEKASTDNEKITALLLVSKVVRAGEITEGERRQIFNAVGFSFINRLLNTLDDPEASDPSDYQRLAVTLLASFSTDPLLATHSEITSKIPLLLQFISMSSVECETLRDDCVQVLLSLSHSPRGLHLLVASGCLQTAARALVEGGRCKTGLGQLLIHLLSHTAVVDRHRQEAAEAVILLAHEFRVKQDELKFELCNTLCSILGAAGEVLVRGREPWIEDIAIALCDILSSKISGSMRESALLLAAHLSRVSGAEWTLTSGDSKLFRLLVHLTAVEVRMCVEGRELEEVAAQPDLLCCYCVILETSVMLTVSTTASCGLSEEDILQLRSAFFEAFQSITEFLSSLPPPLSPHNSVIIALTRVLGAWLAEESLAVTSELYQLLPRLLDMCKTELREAGESVDELGLENPLKFLLPGLSHLVADDKPRAIVKSCLPQLLLEYMTTLYTSLSTMSDEAVSSFTLSVEVLLTVCVCEVELRSSDVFCEIARLLSKLLVSDSPSPRLSLQATLLWLMITRQRGQRCCIVEWSEIWSKVASFLVTTLQSALSQTLTTEPLIELWHLAMREARAIALSMADVKQLLLASESMTQLTTLTNTGEEELETVRRLLEALH